jgi:serine/threonine protein phosphatase PrpC
MFILACTEKAPQKDCNEDCVFVNGHVFDEGDYHAVQTDRPTVFAIADGVGGNHGGHYAARYVLEHLVKFDWEAVDSTNDIAEILRDVNRCLIEYSATKAGFEHMATTLTGVLLRRDAAWYFHIGNTRLYTCLGGYCKQISNDHTTKNWLLTRGMDASTCNPQEITACLGNANAAAYRDCEVCGADFLLSASFLLTTDGIHDVLTADEMESRLDDVSKLITAARERGSTDDCSAIYVSAKPSSR